MVPEDLATYSENDLERLAIEDLRRRPDVEFSAPINVELLIECLPNVTLKLKDGLRAKHRVEGMVLKASGADKSIEVWVDSLIYAGPWHCYNATLGEEYAHLRIHRGLFLCVSTIDEFVALQSDPQWARHEADARRFSDAIRMPAELLNIEAAAIYPRLVNEVGFHDTLGVYNLLRGKLAGKFRVTTEDVLRRMQQPQVRLEDRLLSSLQSRSFELIPHDWIVEARPRGKQAYLFEPFQ